MSRFSANFSYRFSFIWYKTVCLFYGKCYSGNVVVFWELIFVVAEIYYGAVKNRREKTHNFATLVLKMAVAECFTTAVVGNKLIFHDTELQSSQKLSSKIFW